MMLRGVQDNSARGPGRGTPPHKLASFDVVRPAVRLCACAPLLATVALSPVFVCIVCGGMPLNQDGAAFAARDHKRVAAIHAGFSQREVDAAMGASPDVRRFVGCPQR